MEQTFDPSVYLSAKFNEFEHDLEGNSHSVLDHKRKVAFVDFQKLGFPSLKNEEWKYTNVTSIFKNGFTLASNPVNKPLQTYQEYIIDGTESANHLFFINGIYDASASKIVSPANEVTIKPFYEAVAGEEHTKIAMYFGCSSIHSPDGIHALNTAFANNGLYIEVKANKIVSEAIYLHFIGDSTLANTLSLPRNLFFLNEKCQVKIIEDFVSKGEFTSLTNIVSEVIVEDNALLEYYKIQQEKSNANHVGTTHILQTGKSVAHAVTISLSGGVIRNNLHLVIDAPYAESNMSGLYLLDDETHVDNHTVADHRKPNGSSNELYKGILDGYSTGVFNGKIFVQKDAQKTNAYQSNKNILLSNNATINTKPQLEIFADDVKCSHGCTTGQLDQEALFYLRSRGISERTAKAMLTKAYVQDILNTIKIPALRNYLEGLIEKRFEDSIQ